MNVKKKKAIEFTEEICDKIFEILRDKITFTNERDKDCMLALDEMSNSRDL